MFYDIRELNSGKGILISKDLIDWYQKQRTQRWEGNKFLFIVQIYHRPLLVFQHGALG